MSKLLKSKFLLGVLVVAVNGCRWFCFRSIGFNWLFNHYYFKSRFSRCRSFLPTDNNRFSPADGGFGLLKAAVMAWQAGHGLVADRSVGAMTHAALMGGAPSAGLPAGCTSTAGYSATNWRKMRQCNVVFQQVYCFNRESSSTTGKKCDSSAWFII